MWLHCTEDQQLNLIREVKFKRHVQHTHDSQNEEQPAFTCVCNWPQKKQEFLNGMAEVLHIFVMVIFKIMIINLHARNRRKLFDFLIWVEQVLCLVENVILDWLILDGK